MKKKSLIWVPSVMNVDLVYVRNGIIVRQGFTCRRSHYIASYHHVEFS